MTSAENYFSNDANEDDITGKISQHKIVQAVNYHQENNPNSWEPGYELKNGRYIIEKQLDEGGFGIVYLARDKRYNQKVVIKTLKPEFRNPEDWDCWDNFEEKFVNEAIKLIQCQHPHIVKFKSLIKSDGKWGIVMEYIEGQNLGKWVKNNGILTQKDALLYIHQVGEALIVIHDQELLHRDVKPNNIMRTSDGLKVILIDMGIARQFSRYQTQTHTPIATDTYAAPEQYDIRYPRGEYTDVYALAATLYFLLTKQSPVPSSSRIQTDTLEPPNKINPDISNRVNSAILRGMELNYKDRPQTIQEWLNLLPLSEPIETPFKTFETKLLREATLTGFAYGLLTFWLAPNFPQPQGTWIWAIVWLLFIFGAIFLQYRGFLSHIPRKYSKYGLIFAGTILGIFGGCAYLLHMGSLKITFLMTVFTTAFSYLIMFSMLKFIPRRS